MLKFGCYPYFSWNYIMGTLQFWPILKSSVKPLTRNDPYLVWRVPRRHSYYVVQIRLLWLLLNDLFLYACQIMEWPCPSTIACEREILKTTCVIDFIFGYGLNTTKTLDAIDLGHSTKTKMAATAVWRLTLYPMQDIACERGRVKTTCQIDNILIWP